VEAAAAATGRRVPSTLILAPRAPAHGVPAASAALARPPSRGLLLDAPQAGNAVVLLAGILMTALALFMGWHRRSWHRRR
jgi:hypothetical protein